MSRFAFAVAIGLVFGGSEARAQQPAKAPAGPKPPEFVLADSVAADPEIAPYPIHIVRRNGRITLEGRVGTKQVYDAVIRAAIASGVPFSERLVIDTGEAARVGMSRLSTISYPYGTIPGSSPPYPLGAVESPYPPSLLLPRFSAASGFDPPDIYYPPGWRETVGRRGQVPNALDAVARIAEKARSDELSIRINNGGVAVLSGRVASEKERESLQSLVKKLPGVRAVEDRLFVDDPADDDQVPPPPTPAAPPPPTPAPPPAPAETPIRPEPREPLPRERPAPAETARNEISRSLDAIPELAGKNIRVETRSGVAAIEGELPSALEAMIAYLAVKRTDGVERVLDRLRFPVPDESSPNPLLKGKPEDVEDYLTDQLRRHLGEIGTVESLRLQGNRLSIRGKVDSPENRSRYEAALRLIPLLRGFEVVADL